MPRRSKRLGVWLGDTRIAELEQRAWPEIRLRYTDAALGAWPQNSPLVSCSLPLGERPQDARAFCKGLLPEGQALQTLAARAGLAVNDTFELLARFGRDIAGALIISADRPEPRRYDTEPYTPGTLAQAIDDLDEHPLGAHDDSELSLAGLQDKLLLVRVADGWGRPLHGEPSTHILKVDDLRFPGLVEAEGACLRLARAAGLTTIDASLETIADRPCLIVSRYDRELARDGTVTRIHQEDLCQALDLDSEANRGRGKYQAAGGPALRDAARLLDTYAVRPGEQLDRLTAAVTFTVLTGNADAHGKNLSLLHRTPETVELAPLYDTVPTALWPKLRPKAAMTIGGRDDLAAITADDVLCEAASWAHPRERAKAVMRATVEQVLDAARADTHSGVAELVVARARALQRSGYN